MISSQSPDIALGFAAAAAESSSDAPDNGPGWARPAAGLSSHARR
jgi:hypothetical protein